ncbi:MAG: hypothetical protein ACI9KE_002035 [Polyangiales bacterium]|jgi:hypothetical protein
MRFVAPAALFAVVGGAFFVGLLFAKQVIQVHNGLGVVVVVSVDGERVEVEPGRQGQLAVAGGELEITTTTQDGQTIEAFIAEDVSGMSAPVYNVAGATGFVRRRDVDGPAGDTEFVHGRILDGDEDADSSSTVLEAMDNPIQIFSVFPQEVARAMATAHLRWDPPSSPNYLFWIYALPTAERAAHVNALYEAEPTPRLLMMTLSLMDAEEEAVFCDAARAVPAPAGHAAIEAAFCARDGRIMALANTEPEPWVQLMAGDQAFREHEFEVALGFYEHAGSLQQNNEANLSSRMARTLRLLGRFAEALNLPSDGGMYDYYSAIERRDPNALEAGGAAWMRRTGGFDARYLGMCSVATMGDDLALGAGSLDAPEAWREALARSNQPFQRTNAAVVAWGLSWAMNDTALRERAALAYVALEGPLDLAELDMNAYRAQPERLIAGESQRGLEHQTHVRLAGIMAWGDDAPAEWRSFVEAALFMAERPHVDGAR